MRVLSFDGRTGAAGDVICGALVSAGADPSVVRVLEEHLPVRYEFADVTEQGIAGVRARVLHAADNGRTDDEYAGDDHGQSHDHVDGSHDHATHDHAGDDTTHGHAGDDTTHGHAGDDTTHDHAGDDTTHGHSRADDHDHASHDHSHADGGHGHTHEHDAEGTGPARSYAAVREIVSGMDLPAAVEENALAIFETLGEAEAAVHGTELEQTTFHEVGTDDAIADVVGAAALVADLDPDRIVTTPVAVGGGEVTFSHGTYPVPAPAVTRIAERTGLAVVGGPVDRELLTPTGAAILGTLADSVERLPPTTVEGTGYGVGAYDLDDRPNVLRASVGVARDDEQEHADSKHASSADRPTDRRLSDDTDRDSSADRPTDRRLSADTDRDSSDDTESSENRLVYDDIAVLETNLDDATPEVLGSLQETLGSAGATDVTILPTTMKKARPGHLVKVLCDPSDARRLARRLAVETGTLGVREVGATHRWIADRRMETATITIDGNDHEVTVKVASDGEELYDVSGEYDDALAVAQETGVAVRDVRRRAERVVRDRLGLD